MNSVEKMNITFILQKKIMRYYASTLGEAQISMGSNPYKIAKIIPILDFGTDTEPSYLVDASSIIPFIII